MDSHSIGLSSRTSQSVSVCCELELLPVVLQSQTAHTCRTQSYTHIEQLHIQTHTSANTLTHTLLLQKDISWPLPWVMTGVYCIRVWRGEANIHISSWWDDENHLWCNKFWLILCCHRWEGSDLPFKAAAKGQHFSPMTWPPTHLANIQLNRIK